MNPNEPIPEAVEAAEVIHKRLYGHEHDGSVFHRSWVNEQAKDISRACEAYAKRVNHLPDCDVNDINPDGIRKPCNCLQQQLTELQRENAELKKDADKNTAETLKLITRAEKIEKALADCERWQREVLTDFKIPFDDHETGRRIAFTLWMAQRQLEYQQLLTLRADVKNILHHLTEYQADKFLAKHPEFKQ